MWWTLFIDQSHWCTGVVSQLLRMINSWKVGANWEISGGRLRVERSQRWVTESQKRGSWRGPIYYILRNTDDTVLNMIRYITILKYGWGHSSESAISVLWEDPIKKKTIDGQKNRLNRIRLWEENWSNRQNKKTYVRETQLTVKRISHWFSLRMQWLQ